MALSIKSHYQKVKAFYTKYESLFMPALIIWGFVYHYLTFKIIPVNEVLYLVFGYLALATFVILFTHLYDAGKITTRLRYVRLFIPLLLQFFLGSIIGGVFIFYWFSGSIFVSWPFIALIIGLIVAMEMYKHYLENPLVQFGLYNFAAFLLFAVALPYFFTSLNPVLFIAGGLLSLILVFLLLTTLGKSPAIQSQKYKIIGVCVFIFAGFNALYFFNLIPPVPLSIRDAGIYHNVYRSGAGYIVAAEPKTFWDKISLSPAIHIAPGERAFLYTSIYSPADLNTDIIHDWQYYNPGQKKWISMSKLSFPITGGRQEGYRGYSYKTNLPAGKWRVYVKTPRGQVLGRYEFTVEQVDQQPALVQEQK